MNCPHCNTPIDEHEATHCLDAWIARVVLRATGWETPYIEFVGTTLLPLPYSTDIAAAWRIVEKLGRLALQAPGSFDMNENHWSPGEEWAADFRAGRILVPSDELIYTYALACSAPLAICRAALKAVEYERTKQASA